MQRILCFWKLQYSEMAPWTQRAVRFYERCFACILRRDFAHGIFYYTNLGTREMPLFLGEILSFATIIKIRV